MLALLVAHPALHLSSSLPRAHATHVRAVAVMSNSLFPLSRRETLLLFPLTLVGLTGIRYATTDAFPVSLEGPIARAPSVNMGGKVVVITGANTGLGFESALKLAEEGATVVLAGRSATKLA